MKKIIIVLSFLLAISVILNIYLLFNQNNDNKKDYLEGNYGGIIFYPNGTMTYNSFRGTYSYSPKMQVVSFSFVRNNREETYTSKVDENNKALPDFQDQYLVSLENSLSKWEELIPATTAKAQEIVQLYAYLNNSLTEEKIEEIGEKIRGIQNVFTATYKDISDGKKYYAIISTKPEEIENIKTAISKIAGIDNIEIIEDK